MKNEQNPRLHLQQRIFYLSMLGVFTVAIIVAAAGMIPFFNTLLEHEYQSLKFSHQLGEGRVTQYFNTIKSLSDQITSRSRIRQELEKFNTGKISLEELQNFTHSKLQDALLISEEVKGISRFDQNGSRVVSVGSNFKNFKLDERAGQEGKTTVVGPVLLGETPHFIVVAPVRNRQSVIVGKDVVLFGIQGLQKIALEHNREKRDSHFLLAYRSEGSYSFLDLQNTSQTMKTINNDVKTLLLDTADDKIGMQILGDSVLGIDKPVITYSLLGEDGYALVIISSSESVYETVIPTVLKVSGIIMLLLFLSGTVLLVILRPLKDQAIEKQNELEKDIKVLQEIVPICMYCKSIRNDKGYWKRIENYIEDMSEVNLSHGICETCMKEKYPDYEKEISE